MAKFTTPFTTNIPQAQSRPMTEPTYFSFLQQSFHYFSRPHEGIPASAISSQADWRGPDMKNDKGWRVAFSDSDIEEITIAIREAKSSGKNLGALTKEDFPLPTLSEKIKKWRKDILHGRGFQVISGLPVADWHVDEREIFFWCFGLHLGRPGAQNQNDELLGHVRDTGADKKDPFVRQYMTTQNIPFHCDAADVVGLFCVNKAKSGGQSRIASSVGVFNELLKERPDLAPLLFEPFMLDTRQEDGVTGAKFVPIPPCQFGGGVLRTFYHSEYFRTSQRHEGVELTEDQNALLDTYDAILASPGFYLDMDLEPGDIQLLSNHVIVHARTDYEDYPEPERKRHLLRLWLSIEDDR